MPSGSIPCVVYAVKSTADVRDAVPDQIRVCHDAIERDADRFLVSTFSEDARSGFLGNRGPELRAAMDAAKGAAAEHGKAELWVRHSSRFARGSGERDAAQSLLKIHVLMLEEGVRLRSVDDDAMLAPELVGIASAQSTKYSADMSSFVNGGKDRQFLAGKRTGGPTPDGLRKTGHRDTNDVRYVRDEDRAPVIEEAFRLAALNHGDGVIARMLNGAGHRTRSGRPYSRRGVQDLLTNPTYCGRVVRTKGRRKGQPSSVGERQVLPDDVETNIDPLVTREEFDAVQALRSERDRSAGGRREPAELGKSGGRPTTRYALAGIAICGRCSGPVHVDTSGYRRKTDGVQRRYYKCANVKGATGVCDAPKIDALALDRLVIEHLPALFNDYAGWIARQSTGNAAEIDRLNGLLDDNVRQIAKIDGQISSMTVEYAENTGTPAAPVILKVLTERHATRDGLSAEGDALRARIAVLEAQDASQDVHAAHRQTLAAAVQGDGDGQAMAAVNAELRVALSAVILDTTDERVTASILFHNPNRPNDAPASALFDVDGTLMTKADAAVADPLEFAYQDGEPSTDRGDAAAAEFASAAGIDLNSDEYWRRANPSPFTYEKTDDGVWLVMPASGRSLN